jgi:hypothetical protein
MSTQPHLDVSTQAGKGGITPLMAVCITSGPDSPQRALAFIRDNVDVIARDHKRRTALHFALGVRDDDALGAIDDDGRTSFYSELGMTFGMERKRKRSLDTSDKRRPIYINPDLVRVLVDACPDLVKMKDYKGILPIAYACKHYAPHDVIKQLFNVYPDGIQEAQYYKFSTSTLVLLAYEKTVKEQSFLASCVANALSNNSSSNVNAGVALALTVLAHEKAVKENSVAAGNVAGALKNISKSDAGRFECLAAGTPLALTILAGEKAVKENSDAAGNVAGALENIATTDVGRQSCIDSGAPLALVLLSREEAVRERGYAARSVAGALCNIARNDEGRFACIVAGAPLALTELANTKVSMRNVAHALKNIAMNDAGIQACIDAGAHFALVALASDEDVIKDYEAAMFVAEALSNISRRQACIDACVPLALTELARTLTVRENPYAAKYSYAARSVAGALSSIAQSDLGRKACIDVGAPLALVSMIRTKIVEETYELVRNVAEALNHISKSDAGRLSCITAGAPLVLQNLSNEEAVEKASVAAYHIVEAYKTLTGRTLQWGVNPGAR